MTNLRQSIITVAAVMCVLGVFAFFAHDGFVPRGSQAISATVQGSLGLSDGNLSAKVLTGIQTSFSELNVKLDRLGQNMSTIISELNVELDRLGQSMQAMPLEKEQPHRPAVENTKKQVPASNLWVVRQKHNQYKRELPDWSTMWQDIRIYVYPDSYSIDGPSTQSLGYGFTEQFLYDNIRRVAVKNPDDANLFCMPIHTIKWGNTVNETSIAAMNDYFRKIYTKYPHWEKSVRRGLVNHFFIVAHDHGGNRASGSKFYLDRSILLANSASSCMGQISCEDFTLYGQTPKWYNIGKDVSTVPFPSVWDPKKKQYPVLQNPRPKPKWTAIFIGGYRQRAQSLDLVLSDPRVNEDPKWFIKHDGPSAKKHGFHNDNYWSMLQESKFALHFHGHQPFSSRLFEIIAAGTVPVIISPGYVLPFEDFLDWDTFSISVTGHRISQLYSVLSNITDAQYETLLANVGRISHHFRYNDPPQPGDAFYMTMWTTYFRSQTISVPYVSGAIQEGEATPDYRKNNNR
eukprot:TRINITY_DN10862_c0_g1_i3.p1 TRINITY_DN10862_c0_g1~~TRINITY_DN10862_c0_g1_i3.p1  ORF type:complete len:516 (-),score=55.71 TRINITY_DN10862_c0_g1_i3:260-1807(-)